MVNRKRSNDDDDFVTPPPQYKSTVGQIQAESFPCLNTRFPPERLIQTLELLTDEQRNIVASMGFGAALSMRLGKLPRMLTYWVVDSYNPATSSIRVNGQTIAVTRETIHDIYGIPMGDIPMSNPLKANHEDDVVRLWKAQFPKEVKRICLNHVIQKIVNDSQVGPLFIMNFLVLYVSVMIGFPSMGTVNQSFLENIKLDVHINRLDWCGFVLTCLNASRITWNRSGAQDNIQIYEFGRGKGGDDIETIVRELHATVDDCVDRLSSNLEKLRLYRDTQKGLKSNVDEDTIGEEPMSNKEFIESVVGVSKRNDIQVRVPEGIRNKGSKKRLISEKEKAIMNAKKGSRKCGGCGVYVEHNARTCPNKQK